MKFNTNHYINTGEKMSPSRARALIEKARAAGFVNRRLSLTEVAKHVRDIRDGRWDPNNGMPICLTPDGILINGYHRLTAIIEAGTEVRISIAFNVPRSSYKRIDTGPRKTLGEILRERGVTISNVTALGALARTFLAYKRRVNQDILTILAAVGITNDAADELVGKDSLLVDIAVQTKRSFKVALFPAPGVIMLAWRIACNYGQDAAFDFFESVGDGAGLASTSPAYKLRERLLQLKATGNSTGIRNRANILWFCLRCFKATLNGDPVKRLQLPGGRPELPKFRTPAQPV